jgi:SSS family solute:Na+ symporter
MLGLICGVIIGSLMVFSQHFNSLYPLTIGGMTVPMYAALIALVCNLGICIVLTPVFQVIGVARGRSTIAPSDFEVLPLSQR